MNVPVPAEQVSSSAHLSDLRHIPGISDADTSLEILSYFEDIVVFLQHFNKHTTVQEIKAFLVSLERRADYHLCFLFHQSSRRMRLPTDSHSHFPIQFGSLIFGTLSVRKRLDQPGEPALPLQLAQALALLCGWLLHTYEQSMFIWSYQQPEVSTYKTLTKREHEVLTLMCHGKDLEAVADALCISTATVTKHKQHIYQQLGVHNIRDALHVSYHYRLVSFLDELYAWRSY